MEWWRNESWEFRRHEKKGKYSAWTCSSSTPSSPVLEPTTDLAGPTSPLMQGSIPQHEGAGDLLLMESNGGIRRQEKFVGTFPAKRWALEQIRYFRRPVKLDGFSTMPRDSARRSCLKWVLHMLHLCSHSLQWWEYWIDFEIYLKNKGSRDFPVLSNQTTGSELGGSQPLRTTARELKKLKINISSKSIIS